MVQTAGLAGCILEWEGGGTVVEIVDTICEIELPFSRLWFRRRKGWQDGSETVDWPTSKSNRTPWRASLGAVCVCIEPFPSAGLRPGNRQDSVILLEWVSTVSCSLIGGVSTDRENDLAPREPSLLPGTLRTGGCCLAYLARTIRHLSLYSDMEVKIEYAKNPVLRKGIELARIIEEIGKPR